MGDRTGAVGVNTCPGCNGSGKCLGSEYLDGGYENCLCSSCELEYNGYRQVRVTCGSCKGSGRRDRWVPPESEMPPCGECRGTGKVTETVEIGKWEN